MEEKQQWSSRLGFIFAAVGSAVGLGNIWRFPYVVYTSGGGAFFIPYITAVLTAGIPLLIFEYTVGHKYRLPPPQALGALKGGFNRLGWWSVISNGFILCYYSVILGWSVNYLVLSLGAGWGSDSNAFFHGDFLKLSDSPTKLGSMQWYVLAGILLLWFLCYLICRKGIKSGLERINKILLPLLIIIMIIITVRSLFLQGAMEGLKTLFTPDFNALASPSIWIMAYGQVFFSLSLASGIMITLSSYLPKKSDINGSALRVTLANCGFEVLSAVGVFAILGSMMQTQGKSMDELAESGVGLAFVVFPRFFSDTGGAVLGFLFFLCLVFAGLTSAVSMVENLTAPIAVKFKLDRGKTALIATSIGALLSIVFATGAGLYILDIADNFLSSYAIVTVGLLEVILGGWLVKTAELRDYANHLSKIKIGSWWDFCLKYLAPLMLSLSLLQSLIGEILTPYGGYSRLSTVLFGWLPIAAGIALAFILSKGDKKPLGQKT